MHSIVESSANCCSPGPEEVAKRAAVEYAARLANCCVESHQKLNLALREALRIAFVDARLVYVESDHANFILASVARALAMAFGGKSDEAIAAAIEESFSIAIEARLRQLNGPKSLLE